MKIVLRILIILLVAGAVSGAFYLLVNNTSLFTSASGFTGGEGGEFNEGGPHGFGFRGGQGGEGFGATDGNGAQSGNSLIESGVPQRGLHGDGDGGFGGERGGDWSRSLPDLGLHLGLVALVTLGVVLIQKLFNLISRSRHSAPPAASAE
jgi:hypothetical protein